MTVHTLDPLRDSRWSELVERHPYASVFHTTAWLQALQRTYGYEPVVFTSSAPAAALEDGIVFCQVRSWLTGRRLVSLPFSDHCEPLVDGADAVTAMSTHLDRLRTDGGWDYVELRPRTGRFSSLAGATPSERFWFHLLDLRPAEDSLFAACHKNAIQQQIHRADREQLTCDEGRSEPLLRAFYRLLLLTRQRHQLPPQPLAWFRNLMDAFGTAITIRVAHRDRRAVAAILTIRHGDVMVFKYSASDARFHPLGGTQLLLWKTIQDARSTGCTTLDLGRSDTSNHGLTTFKDRWGATRSEISYWRYAPTRSSHSALRKFAADGVKQILGHAPEVCRVAAGRFLYRHAG
jgi:CelD/BcsL family acetyltransferase involved in cellulose biosynthesis